MPLRAALAVLLLVPLAAQAQGVDAPAPLVVMNLAAHPDDEDGQTLAYYRHVKDAVAYSVLFTRGEGGQNEIGPDLYERLGALRTAETERAARLLGTQVYYLNFYDFGFSKRAEEAFAEWSWRRTGFWETPPDRLRPEAGRDSTTARLVYLIRLLKPDVLFTNHDTVTVGERRQHGQHQAVGIAAYDAFALAADPTYHPEQLRESGVELWQPSRLFLRHYRRPEQFDAAVPVGQPCGTHDEPCSALAMRALVEHASQGMGTFAARRGADSTFFTLLRASAGAPPLPPGATDLAAGLDANPYAARVQSDIDYLIASGRVPSLPGGVAVDDPAPVPLQTLRARFAPPVGPATISVGVRSDDVMVTDAAAGAVDFVVESGTATLPAYRQMYRRLTADPRIRYVAATGNAITAAGPVAAEVAPPVVVDLPPGPIRLVAGENEVRASVRVYDPAVERVRVHLNLAQVNGRAGSIASDVVTLAPSDTVAVLRFRTPDAPGPFELRVRATATPTSGADGTDEVRRPANRLDDVRVAPGLRVGFVRSYDDTTERALRAMGADVTLLDSAALATSRFDGLHTIVLDIRAYLARADLRQHNDRLLDWVRGGGHLVVAYHKTEEWNRPDSLAGWAPLPLTLGRGRVTDETAAVTLLQPTHPLFTAPYAITPADFDGWVQERGLYFPSAYDAAYTPLLSMADPGETAQDSSTLLARVGDGTYLYTSLGWYRQLEALNRGAWRLFANLVSLPLTDGRAGAP